MVMAGDITDTRTTSVFNSECKIELKFTGDAVADASCIQAVHVTKALDELGRDLTKPEEKSSFGPSIDDQKKQVLKTEVRLRNPSRNATEIKIIEGTASLFTPTETNGGILRIKGFLQQPGEPIKSPVLKELKIGLMYLTKESYEAKKKQLEEEERKEAGGQIAEGMKSLFSGMFGGMMASSSKNSVKIYLKDPEKKVLEIELQDSKGKPLNRNGSMLSGDLRQLDLREPPPTDAQLLIYLAAPAAMKTYPFKVENIPLP